MVQILKSVAAMQDAQNAWRAANKTIGFVPTMGALHSGHEELLKSARAQNDILVLSIYVNPTQFNDKKDLEKYPLTLEADLEIAKASKVDAVFLPQYNEIYPDDYRYVLSENQFSKSLCGKDRPGHFDGVLTIVLKLFNIIAPTRAYFGEKDFQQLSLIKGMVKALFVEVEIVAVPIVREIDGLAKSSRNVRLNETGRTNAPQIYAIIKASQSPEAAHKALSDLGYQVDYVEDIDARRFVAVKTHDTIDGNVVRLIDNVEI